jgi:two-component system chemotaxis response regulator CheY
MRKKILIVDDTTFMREMLKSALDPEKYQIIGEALNGEQGIEKYKETNPDLVLLDINMPKMNGIDMLSAIIELDPKANVIMCSDQKYDNMIMMALKKGAKDFIIKPFTIPDVRKAVSKVFGEDE